MTSKALGEIGSVADLLRPVRSALAWVVVLSVASNVLIFVSPIYSMQIYDRVLSSRNGTTLFLLTLLALGLYCAYAAIEHYRARTLVHISAALDEGLAGRAFDVAMAGATSVRNVDHTMAVRDAEAIREFFGSGTVLALLDAPWAIAFVALCFGLHPDIGLFALAAGLVLFALSVINHWTTRGTLTEASRISAQSIERLSSSLRHAETARALGMVGTIRGRWFDAHRRALAASITAAERGGTIGGLIKFLRLAVQSGALGLGAWLVLRGEITPGAMFATSILLGRALAPIEMLVAQWKAIVGLRNAWSRLDRALRAMPASDERMMLPRPQGSIQVQGLVVTPPGARRPSLRGIDLTIEPAEVVAIVGRTGSGKSSLARALVGAWTPTSGKVRYDGNDLANHRADDIGRHVGYLPQDVELFAGTVRENIARLAETDDERVLDAACLAHAHEMIQLLEGGYDTPLGEGGAGLSGGQRQRVALARAVFGNPAIVVLDEPNSNLDGEGDASLTATVRDLREKGVTVVVVTHKMDVLAACDRIVVLSEGLIARMGTPGEILAPAVAPGAQTRSAPTTRITGTRA